MVVLFDDIKQLKQGAYKIIDVDNNKNTLTILDENGEEKTVNAKQYGKHFSTYTMNNKEFSKGDKIVFLKNDAKLGVSNGSLGVIHSIDQEGNASVILNNEKSVEFNMKDINANSSYNYIDYAYAVTVHKSQGATTDHTLYFHDSKNAKPSANSLYVAFTRSRNNTMIFTQSTKLLKKHSEKWIKKSSTLDDYQLDNTSKELKESPDNNEKKELSQYIGINFRGLFEKASLKTNEDGKQKSVQKETETKQLPQNEMEI
jgi:UDP-N-acetylglucosamine transferase subunit ALG13